MVLVSPFSRIFCAHCSEEGVCGHFIGFGRDILGCGGGSVSFEKTAIPCHHFAGEWRVQLEHVFAATAESSALLVFGSGGVCEALPASRGGIYSVPLEAGAALEVHEDSRKDSICLRDGKLVSVGSHAAEGLRLAPQAGGFLLREVAFERRPKKHASMALLISPSGNPVDVIVKADVFSTRPVSCRPVSQQLLGAARDQAEGKKLNLEEVQACALGASKAGCIVLQTSQGKEALLSLSESPAAALQGAKVLCMSISASDAVLVIARAAQVYGAKHGHEHGWRVDQEHFQEWLKSEEGKAALQDAA